MTRGCVVPRNDLDTFKKHKNCYNSDTSHHYYESYVDRKIGFTLAEVLITLGIIGVVVAMTMPSLMAKIQEVTLKNQFKKVFNTYSNALQKVISNYGELPACWYDYESTPVSQDWSECNKFYTELAKELNFVKYCDKNIQAQGCLPDYKKFNSEDDGMCPGFKESIVKSQSKAWILSDGSIIFTYYEGRAPVFAFDINGFKKPNKGGYDLFVFQIANISNSLRLGSQNVTHCNSTFLLPGGRTLQEMIYFVNK